MMDRASLPRFSPFAFAAVRLAGAVVLLVAGLAAWNWYLDPLEAATWARVMVGLPTTWGVSVLVALWMVRARAPRPDDEAVRRYAENTVRFMAVGVAAIGLAAAASLTFQVSDALGLLEDTGPPGQVPGMMSGGVLVVLGNGLPKIVTPVSLLPDGGAMRISRMRRFIGRSWVLCGLAIIAMFVFAPPEAAQVARRWMFVASVAAMIAGIVWVNVWPDRRLA